MPPMYGRASLSASAVSRGVLSSSLRGRHEILDGLGSRFPESGNQGIGHPPYSCGRDALLAERRPPSCQRSRCSSPDVEAVGHAPWYRRAPAIPLDRAGG
jgi:hypothetical protein